VLFLLPWEVTTLSVQTVHYSALSKFELSVVEWRTLSDQRSLESEEEQNLLAQILEMGRPGGGSNKTFND
jgi:hypothetical protein